MIFRYYGINFENVPILSSSICYFANAAKSQVSSVNKIILVVPCWQILEFCSNIKQRLQFRFLGLRNHASAFLWTPLFKGLISYHFQNINIAFMRQSSVLSRDSKTKYRTRLADQHLRWCTDYLQSLSGEDSSLSICKTFPSCCFQHIGLIRMVIWIVTCQKKWSMNESRYLLQSTVWHSLLHIFSLLLIRESCRAFVVI